MTTMKEEASLTLFEDYFEIEFINDNPGEFTAW